MSSEVRPVIRAGQVKEITSTANPIVKSIRGLFLKKFRDQQNAFLCEGMKPVMDAFSAGWRIKSLVFAKHAPQSEALASLAAKSRAAGADIIEVNNKVLAAISRRDNPQTVIGVFEQIWHKPQDLLSMLKSPGDIVLGLDRIRDPGNLGTIIRTADAAGIAGIILIGETTDPYSVEAARASMGSIFNVKLARAGEDSIASISGTRAFRVAGTHLSGAVDYRMVDWNQEPAFILMGNEQQGLTDRLASICDDLILIPMSGKADSLNLAIATALTLFEARRGFLKTG